MTKISEILANFPWTLIFLFILVGAGLIWYGNRHTKLGIRSGGLTIVSIALLLGACHFLIDTDAERAERRTRQIVDYADKQDWTHLQSLLDADTSVTLGHYGKAATGADLITDSAKTSAKMVGLKQVFISSLRTKQDDTGITITFRVYTRQEQTQDRPAASDWEFDYHQRDDKSPWDLKDIKLLTVDQQPA